MKNLYSIFRPRKFSEVLFQDDVIKFITQSISNQFIHSFLLFHGAFGMGKTTLARLYIQGLNCEKNKIKTEKSLINLPCQTCESCLSSSSYIYEINASNYCQVEDMREIVKETAYKPFVGQFKGYIFDEFHLFSQKVFSILLKEVEEAPEHVIFICIANNIASIPKALISRAVDFRFNPIGPKGIEEIIIFIEKKLKEHNISVDRKRLEVLKELYESIKSTSVRNVINDYIKLHVSGSYIVQKDEENKTKMFFDALMSNQKTVQEKINHFYSLIQDVPLKSVSHRIATLILEELKNNYSFALFEAGRMIICDKYDINEEAFVLFIIKINHLI